MLLARKTNPDLENQKNAPILEAGKNSVVWIISSVPTSAFWSPSVTANAHIQSFTWWAQVSRSFQKFPEVSAHLPHSRCKATCRVAWALLVPGSGPERGVQKSMRNNAKHCFATQNSRLLQDFGMISFILTFHTSWAQSPSVNQTTIQSIVPSHNNDSCTDPPCLAQFPRQFAG